jgi:hypothetical protein
VLSPANAGTIAIESAAATNIFFVSINASFPERSIEARGEDGHEVLHGRQNTAAGGSGSVKFFRRRATRAARLR